MNKVFISHFNFHEYRGIEMGKEKDYRAAIRFGSLIIVVLQSTITVLLLRYTKTRKTDKLPYLSSSVILSSECLKFIACLIALFVNAGNKY